MNALPCHTSCPSQQSLYIAQLCAIPVLFKDAPTALNRIVLAMVGRIVKQLNRLANLVCEFNHAVEELGANPTTFGAVVYFQLDTVSESLLLKRQTFPPGLQAIDDKITGFMRTAKVEMKLSTIFIDNATRNVLLLAAHVMIAGVWIASGLPTTRISSNVHGRFAIEAQSFDAAIVTFVVFGFDVVKDCIGFGQFFWGIAFTTGFNR
jgi:hypothetical protein